MASNTAPATDDELLHEFGPLLRVYKSGRLERPLVLPPVAPGLDPSTGVQSKDVHLGAYSARLYLPSAAATTTVKLPVIVYIHGGGFVAESAKSPIYHRFLNDLASACPALGVSLDYRLAPEHPLPAAYDDCLDALSWVLSAADPWVAAHGDLDRVFVAGDSAGANICHHIATIQPDVARLRGAVLIHPWFWGSEAVGEETRDPAGTLDVRVPQHQRHGRPTDEPHGTRRARAGGTGVREGHGCTAEGDFLRWRGRAYARICADGEGHVFYLFKPDCDKAKEMLDRIVAFVNAA